MLLTCIKADLELLLQGHLRETGYTDFLWEKYLIFRFIWKTRISFIKTLLAKSVLIGHSYGREGRGVKALSCASLKH